VTGSVEKGGGKALDLLPAFHGRSATELWVHPTDQHPNEVAHRIAAKKLAEFLAQDPEVRAKIEALK
jgi:hypothetical protein